MTGILYILVKYSFTSVLVIDGGTIKFAVAGFLAVLTLTSLINILGNHTFTMTQIYETMSNNPAL